MNEAHLPAAQIGDTGTTAGPRPSARPAPTAKARVGVETLPRPARCRRPGGRSVERGALRQLLLPAAVRIHDIDLGGGPALAGEGDPPPVRRPGRAGVAPRVPSQVSPRSAVPLHDVDLPWIVCRHRRGAGADWEDDLP